LQPADALGAAARGQNLEPFFLPCSLLRAFCLVASLLVVTLSKPGKPSVVPATA
jgi:hypothetical protein